MDYSDLYVLLSPRAHFKKAQEAWQTNGALSSLYVIIIDEIDAICKPRGESILLADLGV